MTTLPLDLQQLPQTPASIRSQRRSSLSMMVSQTSSRNLLNNHTADNHNNADLSHHSRNRIVRRPSLSLVDLENDNDDHIDPRHKSTSDHSKKDSSHAITPHSIRSQRRSEASQHRRRQRAFSLSMIDLEDIDDKNKSHASFGQVIVLDGMSAMSHNSMCSTTLHSSSDAWSMGEETDFDNHNDGSDSFTTEHEASLGDFGDDLEDSDDDEKNNTANPHHGASGWEVGGTTKQHQRIQLMDKPRKNKSMSNLLSDPNIKLDLDPVDFLDDQE